MGGLSIRVGKGERLVSMLLVCVLSLQPSPASAVLFPVPHLSQMLTPALHLAYACPPCASDHLHLRSLIHRKC